MNKNNIHIIISGGGTGGHIFPAIAIANGLKNRLGEKVKILFVGAKGHMEMEKVPKAGYKIKGLWISGFQRNLTLTNLLFPLKLIISLCKSKKIIKNFIPDVAIGTGGYASGPILYIATKKRIPTLILEQNSYPGITNKILAKSVNRICTAYKDMGKYFPENKIKVTGSPIRQEIFNMKPTQKEALDFFNLKTGKKTILIIGGSQGAQKINKTIAVNIDKIVSQKTQLIWQTGKTSLDFARNSILQLKYKDNIKIYDFIYEMDKAYAAADLIVSRAGAIAIAEIIAVNKPAIFIPLPTAAEDHQTHNAQTLIRKNAAIMIKENQADEKLANVITTLINDNNKLDELKKNLNKFERKNATNLIVDEIIDLINNR